MAAAADTVAASVAARTAPAAAAAVPTMQAAGVCVESQARPPSPAVAFAAAATAAAVPSPKPSYHRNFGRVSQFIHVASLPIADFPTNVAFRLRSAVESARIIRGEFGQLHLVPLAADTSVVAAAAAAAAVLPVSGALLQ